MIWSMLGDDRPVHVLHDDQGNELRDGVGAILADRVDPSQLAALLERWSWGHLTEGTVEPGCSTCPEAGSSLPGSVSAPWRLPALGRLGT